MSTIPRKLRIGFCTGLFIKANIPILSREFIIQMNLTTKPDEYESDYVRDLLLFGLRFGSCGSGGSAVEERATGIGQHH